jgi:DNA replicative helicase MCM subunit Mcm2 (Cdc46/Mcm family)
MSAEPSNDKPQELRLTDAMKQCSVKRFSRQGSLLRIDHSLEKNGKIDWTTILFKIKPEGFFATLQDFEDSCYRSKIPRQITQQIMAALSPLDDDYYENALKYYDNDNDILGTAIKIGDFFEDKNDRQQQRQQQGTSSASSNNGGHDQEEDPSLPPSQLPEAESDADYPDDNGGLNLITISETLQLDRPQPVRVIGLIDVIRTQFDLIKQIVLMCITENCPNRNKRETRTLKVGMFSVYDLPFVFPDGREALDLFCRCNSCHLPRRIEAGQGRYQSARIIELRNVAINASGGNSTNNNPSNTEYLDRLMVLVFGRHAQDIAFSEEVEMIGELQILPSSVIEARRGTGSGRNNPGHIFAAEPGGKYQKIFYAKHIKYTKRELELHLTERNIIAIKKFASLPNLIPRLVSMFAPNVAGFENAKLGLLLQAVGPAPYQKKNWYRRTWINAGLFGDPGTAKTILGEEAVKLLPGSQTVSGQHSTGKGVVAIAEKEADGSAFVRAGAAVLANNASCFIDEIGSMRSWDDQDQFLDLMNKGYCDFNKLGIRKRIYAKTNFIVGANPTTFNWQYPDKIDKSELPIKLTLIDRLDFIHIFRDAQGEQDTKEWSAKMFELSQKHINTDYIFLRKYIHHIRTEAKFKQVEFADIELAQKLSDAWTEIKVLYPSLISRRGYESIFRTAKAFARLMCKDVVDNEVIEQTIDFIREMYRAFGTEVINKSMDPQDMVFAEICQVIKSFADGLEYIMTEDESSFDITLNEAAQRACDKISEVRDYFGIRQKDNGKLKVNSNRRLRNIHRRFIEAAGINGIEYQGGKIKVVSDMAPRGLTLRWVTNSDAD